MVEPIIIFVDKPVTLNHNVTFSLFSWRWRKCVNMAVCSSGVMMTLSIFSSTKTSAEEYSANIYDIALQTHTVIEAGTLCLTSDVPVRTENDNRNKQVCQYLHNANQPPAVCPD